jgi:hypothetical protein
MNIPEFTFTAIATTATGAQELVAAAAGKTPRLHGLLVAAAGACTVKIESGSSVGSTDLSLIGGAIPVAANAYVHVPFERTAEGGAPGTVAKNLQISSTASGLSGWAHVSSSSY